MYTLEKIQKEISTAIKQSGLSQTEISKRMGVSQQIISSYVNCKKLPSLDTFAILCDILDLDSNEILGLNDKY